MALADLNKITVNKEKNFLNFINEDGIILYHLDINTGDFFGQKKKLSRIPQGFRTALIRYILPKNQKFFNFLKLISILLDRGSIKSLEQNSDVFRVVDKLYSIKYTKEIFAANGSLYVSAIENLKYVEKNFKIFSTYFRENPQIDIYDFVLSRQKQEFFEKLCLPEETSEDIKEIIWKYRNDFNEKQLKLFVYYLIHGLYDFFVDDTIRQTSYYKESFKREQKIDDLILKVHLYFRMCEELKIQPKKENFFQSFVNARRSCVLNQTAIDNKILEEHYSQKNLFFENSDFEIVLPTTKEILFKEGQEQKNCVYNHYLKYLLKKQTYIVLVRRKSNINKSYITCQISLNGNIIQYLGVCNSKITDEKALSFKKEYQEYLNKNF